MHIDVSCVFVLSVFVLSDPPSSNRKETHPFSQTRGPLFAHGRLVALLRVIFLGLGFQLVSQDEEPLFGWLLA